MAATKYNRQTTQRGLVWLHCRQQQTYFVPLEEHFWLAILGNKYIISAFRKETGHDEDMLQSKSPGGLVCFLLVFNVTNWNALPTLTSSLVGQQLVAFLAAALKAAHSVSAHMITPPIVETTLINVWEQKNMSRLDICGLLRQIYPPLQTHPAEKHIALILMCWHPMM